MHCMSTDQLFSFLPKPHSHSLCLYKCVSPLKSSSYNPDRVNMGKDWYWSARSSKREATCKARNTSSGCVGAVLQFFDFNHFRFCLHQSPSSLHLPPAAAADDNHSTVLKGMEAPRNSLEIELQEEEDHKLPTPVGMQIKTRSDVDERRSLSNDLSISGSPAAKTPTLVARLMGLDFSPTSSVHRATPPSAGYNKSHLQRPGSSGTRSLPETPRVSSSSRRSVDSDRRLSLQINNENATEPLELKQQDRNRIHSEYARQIVKQVKENVTKRAGLMDITNTSVSRNREQRRDQELLIRSKKSGKDSSTGSPRPRLSENKNTPTTRSTARDHRTNSQTLSSLQLKEAEKGCKKMTGGERFRSRLNKPPQTSDIMRKHKQEEPFIRQSSVVAGNKANTAIPRDHKKTPLISSAVKKHPSSPATKFLLLQNQSNKSETGAAQESRQGSAFPSFAGQKATYTHIVQYNPNGGGVAAATSGGAEYQYVTRILKRTGIQKDTKVSLATWYSPTHPLDPSIFHQLELSHHQATDTATRKLIFHLVDEMLVEIFGPHTNVKPWSSCTSVARNFGHVKSGSELVDTLCTKMRSFPAKDCRTLEDIDAIIDDDLPERKIRDVSRLAFEEEGESVVTEIERYVMDTLVYETSSIFFNIGRFRGEL